MGDQHPAAPGGTPDGGVFPDSRLPEERWAWQAMGVAAVATFALGLVLLVWPGETVVVAAILLGIVLLVTGILRLAQGIAASERSGATRGAYVVIGILAILAGLYCLRHLAVSVALLALVVGLFWVVHGVAEIMVAVTSPAATGSRGLLGFAGVLSVAAGVVVLFWPGISLTVLVLVLGAWLLADGVLLAFMALRLHAAVKSGRPHGRLGRPAHA